MYFGIAEHPRGFCYPFFMGEKPAREKGVLKSPQAFQNPKIINNLSAEYAQSNAEGIPNRLVLQR